MFIFFSVRLHRGEGRSMGRRRRLWWRNIDIGAKSTKIKYRAFKFNRHYSIEFDLEVFAKPFSAKGTLDDIHIYPLAPSAVVFELAKMMKKKPVESQ